MLIRRVVLFIASYNNILNIEWQVSIQSPDPVIVPNALHINNEYSTIGLL